MRDGKEYCPFCGEHNARVKHSGRWGYFVSCKCTAVGPSRSTSGAAIEAWNTRKQPKPDNQQTLFPDEKPDYLCDMCANDCDERKVIKVGQGAYSVCERWVEAL